LSEPASIQSLVEGYVARGVFRAAAQPPGKAGSERYSIVWFRNQRMILDVDLRRSRASLDGVLPPIGPRSRFDRALRAWLRSREAPERPAHRRLDPDRFHARLRIAAGSLQLSVLSKEHDAALAVRTVLDLTHELYLDFLSAPERYDWIVETFALDPDNPRWP